MASKAQRLADIVQTFRDALADLEELKDETETWRDSMEGTNFEGGEKFETVSAAADVLDEQYSTIESALDELDGVEFP